MANPEMPAPNDPPAPAAAPDPAPDPRPTDTAIQEKDAVTPIPPTTAVTAGAPPAPADTRPRKAAPTRPGPDPADLAARVRPLDRVLVGLVLVLAFFLGCFAILNSDFWRHLATGRLIAQGELPFGAEPFSFAGEGTTWVNHAWLFDWLLYGLYQVIGGPGLVVLRGLVLVALAGLLLRFRRPGQSLWIPAVCTTLALLVVSTQLPVGPLLVSLPFLVLTLHLLRRGVDEGAACTVRGRSFSPLWLLPPLFALWVNLDGWFVLGPLTVALYFAGAALQHVTTGRAAPAEGSPSGGGPGRLGLVLLACLAACLLNPYLHRAFVLPTDLAYLLADVLPADLVPTGLAARSAAGHLSQLYPQMSPFSEAYALTPSSGQNVAGLAYFVLLLLAGGSFVLRALARPEGAADRFPVGLLLVWLPFAALGVLSTRFLPFFAVVSGPVAALNLQAARRPAEGLTWGQWNWALGGRALTIVGCLVLLLLAWPGWLHGAPEDVRRSHRVSLRASQDPSFEKTARRLEELLQTGKLQNGLSLRPNLDDHLAWSVGPKARLFLDLRFALPPEAAADYGRVGAALHAEANRIRTGQKLTRLGEVARVLRKHRVNYLLVTGLDLAGEMRVVANRLTLEPERWAPLYDDGRTAVFGWRDPEIPGDPFAGLTLDFDRMAFGKVPEAERAPPVGPVTPDGPPGWLRRYALGTPPTPLGASEAKGYLADHASLSMTNRRWQSALEVTLHCAAWAQPPGMIPLANHPYYRELTFQRMHALTREHGVPALPLLAVRAARKGAAESPSEPLAQLALIDAYRVLWRGQERPWAPEVRPLPNFYLSRQLLRYVQYVFALDRAVKLEPDNWLLHVYLHDLFLEMNYPDAALEHALRAQEILRRPADRPGPAQKEREEQRKRLAARVDQLKTQVEHRKLEYDLAIVGGKTAAEKAAIALLAPTQPQGRPKMQRGLARLALKILGGIDRKTLSKEEEQRFVVGLQLDLFLKLGMSKDLRDVFDPPQKDEAAAKEAAEIRQGLKGLLRDQFDVWEALYAAAVGDYAKAEKILEAWEKTLELPNDEKAWGGVARGMQLEMAVWIAGLLAEARLAPMLPPPPTPVLAFKAALQARVAKSNYSTLQQRAECRAVRGLLALEQGDTARAVEHFRECRRLSDSGVGYPSALVVLHYLRMLEPYHPRKGEKKQ
jgi:hypothetical protein